MIFLVCFSRSNLITSLRKSPHGMCSTVTTAGWVKRNEARYPGAVVEGPGMDSLPVPQGLPPLVCPCTVHHRTCLVLCVIAVPSSCGLRHPCVWPSVRIDL